MNYTNKYELANKNLAVVIGHPGHELRILRFIEIYKPRVYVLTDGSGFSGISRINKTKNILDNCGATCSSIFGYFTDKEIYNIILKKDTEPLIKFLDELVADFKEHNIQIVAGDAYEGYNPAHDLCRYIVNFLVTIFKQKWDIQLSNFDFLLDELSDGNGNGESIVIKLDDDDFERKYQAAQQYSELSLEVNAAVAKYGKDAFKTEHLALVTKPDLIHSNDIPFYESYGIRKINEGVYSEAITYSKHLFPLVKKLKDHVDHLELA